MTPFHATKVCFQKYADFSGRASRSEFWWFTLAVSLIAIVLWAVSPVLGGLFLLAVFLPWIAAASRRLHDTNRTGKWLLAWSALYVLTLLIVGSATRAGAYNISILLMGLWLVATALLFAILVLPTYQQENPYGSPPAGGTEMLKLGKGVTRALVILSLGWVLVYILWNREAFAFSWTVAWSTPSTMCSDVYAPGDERLSDCEVAGPLSWSDRYLRRDRGEEVEVPFEYYQKARHRPVVWLWLVGLPVALFASAFGILWIRQGFRQDKAGKAASP